MKGGRNMEGYNDPTANIAVGHVARKEKADEKRVSDLRKVLKYIICSKGFELVEQIKLKDVKSGKEYK